MRIVELEVHNKKEGVFKKIFSHYTHIHSEKNAQGKTTLVRLIIYAMGFDVPLTDKIQPNECKTILKISNKGTQYIIKRTGKTLLISKDGQEKTIVVGQDWQSILTEILEIQNKNILKNMLGIFYIDQEYGWNRVINGKAIGTINTNINQILYGLSDVDTTLFDNLSRVKNIIKYNSAVKRLTDDKKYIDPLMAYSGNNDDVLETEKTIVSLNAELNSYIRAKHAELSKMRKNEEFYSQLASFNIYIKVEDEIVKVTPDNIVGWKLQRDLNTALLNDLDKKIAIVNNKLKRERELLKQYQSTDDLYTEMNLQGYKPSLKVNIATLETNLGLLKDKEDSIESVINNTIESDSHLDKMNELLKQYATELDIIDKVPKQGLLANHFEKMTGTDKQKIVLAYRASVLRYLSDWLGVDLPIIIDSLNRETDKANLNLMITFLVRNFSNHQIIISSIEPIENEFDLLEISHPLFNAIDLKGGSLDDYYHFMS